MQYIGARYVTKIYENSLDPSQAEWEASVNYEPLTMVTYNNGSYLSKKAVPASAGDPPSEPTYWVQTGFYNGQIAYLQSQVDAINARLLTYGTRLGNRRFVILTDSYGQVPSPGNFIDQLQTLYPAFVLNDNFFAFAYGARGFVGDWAGLGQDATWYTAFVTSGDINTVTDPDTITDFVIVGGSNDKGESESDIRTNAATLLSAIHTKFPNANVYLAACAYSKAAAGGTLIPALIEYYVGLSRLYDIIFMGNSYAWMHRTDLVSDNVHPTLGGSRYIATGLLRSLAGFDTEDVSANRNIPNPIGTLDIAGTLATQRGNSWSANGENGLSFDLVRITGASLTGDASWHQLASLAETFLYGATDNLIIAHTSAFITYNGNDYMLPVDLKIYDHHLYYRFYNYGIPGFNGGITGANVEFLATTFRAPAVFL